MLHAGEESDDTSLDTEVDILSNTGSISELLERTLHDIGDAIRPPENFMQSPGNKNIRETRHNVAVLKVKSRLAGITPYEVIWGPYNSLET